MEDMLMYALKLTAGLIGVLLVLRLMGKRNYLKSHRLILFTP